MTTTTTTTAPPAWLDHLLGRAAEGKGSDLHLVSGEHPRFRVSGDLMVWDDEPRVVAADLTEAIAAITTPERVVAFAAGEEIDFAYQLEGGPRFRASAFHERRGPALALRLLSGRPPTLDELGLPTDLARAIYAPGGLVLFAGHAGAGKTTTLASVLQELCGRRALRIVTLEDPIEYRIEPRKAWIEQRELGRHFRTFEDGVREATEAGPDVISVGELRDTETVRLALQAAETGILVFATVHAYDATRSIGRIVDAFPPDDRAAARVALGASLRMIVAQTLLRARTGKRLPAVEVCLGGTAVGALIRDHKEHELLSLIESGKGHGMRSLDDSIVALVRSGQVSVEEGLYFAVHKDSVRRLVGA